MFLPATVTGIHLNLGQGLVISQTLSIRTESSTSLLPSELIVATLSSKNFLASYSFVYVHHWLTTTVTEASDISGSRGDIIITIVLGIAVSLLALVLLATVVVILIRLMLRYEDLVSYSIYYTIIFLKLILY